MPDWDSDERGGQRYDRGGDGRSHMSSRNWNDEDEYSEGSSRYGGSNYSGTPGYGTSSRSGSSYTGGSGYNSGSNYGNSSQGYRGSQGGSRQGGDNSYYGGSNFSRMGRDYDDGDSGMND